MILDSANDSKCFSSRSTKNKLNTMYKAAKMIELIKCTLMNLSFKMLLLRDFIVLLIRIAAKARKNEVNKSIPSHDIIITLEIAL